MDSSSRQVIQQLAASKASVSSFFLELREPSFIVHPSSMTIIDDVVPKSTGDRDEIHTTSSSHSSPNATFIMSVDDMLQTPKMKKVIKRVVEKVNMKDLPANKRKRDNEDDEGYMGLRPKDIVRNPKKGCGT